MTLQLDHFYNYLWYILVISTLEKYDIPYFYELHKLKTYLYKSLLICIPTYLSSKKKRNESLERVNRINYHT